MDLESNGVPEGPKRARACGRSAPRDSPLASTGTKVFQTENPCAIIRARRFRVKKGCITDLFLLLWAAGCATGGAGTNPAQPSQAADSTSTSAELPPGQQSPPSYCATLQKYLDSASQQARTQLTCFDLPGSTDVGFFGPPDLPTAHRFESCFASPDEAKKALVSNSTPFNLGYSYTWSRTFDASGGLDLGFLGKWGPKLKISGGKGAAVEVKVQYEHVHFVRISDLEQAITACADRARAQNCIDTLNDDATLYTPTALVGRLIVTLTSTSRVSGGFDSGMAKILDMKVAGAGADARSITLTSDGDVVIAGSTIKVRKIVKDAMTCKQAYFRDLDGDGFGAAPAVLLHSAPPGFVETSNDCDDTDARAHPGQAEMFATPRRSGGYDYDCDGAETKQAVALENGCFWEGAAPFGNCKAYQGWVGGVVPACGSTALWLDDCDTQGVARTSCSLRETTNKNQSCR